MRRRAHSRLPALIAIGALAACAIVPGAAFGQQKTGRTTTQYQAANLVGKEPVPRTSPSVGGRTGLDARVGSLPFTGWDLIILGGVTLVLSGTGVLLGRLSVPRPPRV